MECSNASEKLLLVDSTVLSFLVTSLPASILCVLGTFINCALLECLAMNMSVLDMIKEFDPRSGPYLEQVALFLAANKHYGICLYSNNECRAKANHLLAVVFTCV